MNKFTTGKVDGSVGPIEHETLDQAELWIAERQKVDPSGVYNGEYYVDGPEEQ